MTIYEEWRIYDPKDFRTHLESISEVDMEFDDGRIVTGLYSRDLGMFSHVGGYSTANVKPLRWRYTYESAEL